MFRMISGVMSALILASAAWIYEKFAEWSDSNRNPESVLRLDDMIDDIMLYWLPGTAASSARMYWENAKVNFTAVELELPVGCSIFPKKIYRAPRSWADRFYRNLIYWNALDRGGHFAAFEQPELFVNELRACFRKLLKEASGDARSHECRARNQTTPLRRAFSRG